MNDPEKHNHNSSSTAPTAMELYDKLPEITGCEVINDEMIMSPSPSREHQLVLIKLSALCLIF